MKSQHELEKQAGVTGGVWQPFFRRVSDWKTWVSLDVGHARGGQFWVDLIVVGNWWKQIAFRSVYLMLKIPGWLGRGMM